MNLKQSSIDGIKWVGVGQFIKYPTQVIISIILARLIAPEGFGLLGMVTVISGFAGLFIDLGFSSALIQKKEVNDRLLSSIFWINIAIGLGLCIIFISLSYPIAFFYDEMSLQPLVFIFSFTFIVPALSSVQTALLTRQMKFDILTKRDIISFISGALIAIIGAYAGLGVWALVLQVYVTSIVGLLLLWAAVSWRPQFFFSISEVKSVWAYGKNLTGFTILNYLIRNLDNFLIGKFISPAALGIYSRGYAFVTLPVRQVSSVLARVMFPNLSKIQDDHERFRRVYMKLCQATALFTFPTMVGLFLVVEPFVKVFLGMAWIEVIPILKIFSLLGASQSIGNTVGWIYNATGRTDVLFKWGIFSGIIIISSFVVGIYLGGIFNVALCYAIGTILFLLIPNYMIPFRIINLRMKTFFSAILPIVGCVIIMSVFVLLIQYVLQDVGDVFFLIGSVLVGITTYVSSLILLNVSIYREVKVIIQQQFKEAKKKVS